MTLTLLVSSIFSSIMFLYLSNPLSLGLTLITQTIILALLLGSMLKSLWFLYLLILVFIGGMLVLFIYVTSIFPNEKFKFNQKAAFSLVFIFLVTAGLTLLYDSFFVLPLNFVSFKNNLTLTENFSMIDTMKIFSSQTNLILIFLVNYLFYCMIVVIKITNFFQGPLRKMT